MDDFDTNDSINPDVEDLLQEDGQGEPVVPVRHVGPVRVHQLPARMAHSGTINVSDVSDRAEDLAEDFRRSYITIICTGQPVFVGHEKRAVQTGVAGILPINVPLTLHTSAALYFRSTNVAGSVVSYWAGNWAD